MSPDEKHCDQKQVGQINKAGSLEPEGSQLAVVQGQIAAPGQNLSTMETCSLAQNFKYSPDNPPRLARRRHLLFYLNNFDDGEGFWLISLDICFGEEIFANICQFPLLIENGVRHIVKAKTVFLHSG